MPKDLSPNHVFNLQDVVESSPITINEPGKYANHVRVAITNNDAILDFYQIGPGVGKPEPQAFIVQRMIVPLALLKGFTTAIANSVAHFEDDNETTLPNSRDPEPDDLIKIWQ